MPTFAIARWATSRIVGLTAGEKLRNRFRRNRTAETKAQKIALEVAGLLLAVVAATLIAGMTESAIDAVVPESWQN
jgi:uncharacterized membrane protein SpoIIM required for sporulation